VVSKMKIFWFGIAFIERIDKKIQAVYFCKTGFLREFKTHSFEVIFV
jgi:hypothetical protein